MMRALSRRLNATTTVRATLGLTFAAGLMFAALPAMAFDGDEAKDKKADSTEVSEVSEACELKEVCMVKEVAITPAVDAEGMGDHPAISDEEKAAYEARAEACRIAQWHAGQGVPYDRFINDRNTMQRLRTDPFVVVQKSSGASRIKTARERAGDEACEDLHESRK